MARVVRFHQTGGPEVLEIENLDVRPPGPRRSSHRREGAGAQSGRVDVPLRSVSWSSRSFRPASATKRRAPWKPSARALPVLKLATR